MIQPPVERITTSIWRIPLPLPMRDLKEVNAYAIGGDDGVTLIDPGWANPESESLLVSGLAAAGWSPDDVRRILVTHAQHHAYAKRGGGALKISLDEVAVVSPERSTELIALDEALKSLTAIDSRRSQVVELRFFGGLGNEEIAEVLKISPNTVTRDWNVAKAWLYREMNKEQHDES